MYNETRGLVNKAVSRFKMKRRILNLSISFMAIVSLFAIGYVLAQSFFPSARALNDAEYVLNIVPLEPGKLQVHKIHGRQLFILKPDNKQIKSIKLLDEHVWNKNTSSFIKELGAYVYWGQSTKFGRPLEHHPIDETFSPGWGVDRNWQGGYWHPWDEVSYDYAGRTISSYEFTYNGFNLEYPNLRVPSLKVVGNKLVVSLL